MEHSVLIIVNPEILPEQSKPFVPKLEPTSNEGSVCSENKMKYSLAELAADVRGRQQNLRDRVFLSEKQRYVLEQMAHLSAGFLADSLNSDGNVQHLSSDEFTMFRAFDSRQLDEDSNVPDETTDST